ncbi:MAG: ABC transporter permease [Rhizobiales bacterium 65-9]|nr:ABC transporter ATP-binding protein [Hyphomicrobiales bacterium]OJY36624.1 MAG: ABC transporter permease [Rhizobiales bacterium 65-9]
MVDASPRASQLLLRLWRDWMARHLPRFIAILFLILVIAGATSLYPVLIKLAFDLFAGQSAASATDAGLFAAARELLARMFGGGTALVHVIAAFVVLVTAAKGFALLGQTILTNRVSARIEADMQTALYAAMIDSDLAQAGRESPAALTQRFTTDFLYVREAIVRIINVVARDLATAICLIGAMIWIDWKLTLAALVVAPVIGAPIAQVGDKLRRFAAVTQRQVAAMASQVAEGLSGLRVAKAYGLETYLKARAARSFEDIYGLAVKAANARGRLDPLLEVGGGVAVAVVLSVIGLRISSGDSTIGDFTGFVTALLLAAQPIRSLGNVNAVLQQAAAALERIYTVLDEKPTIVDAPDARPLVVRRGEIAFNDVRFAYRADVAALNGASLVAEAGKTTAIVGRSGSGKSTLLSLPPRLYDPQNGRVLIDGIDIRAVTLDSLRAQIALVSQDVLLFDDTIRANIGFGRPNAGQDDIVAAAKAAAAHDFIMALPDEYETRVGDRGGNLSGGERQRIVLARAFVRDAPILILDEPTSALDAESERLVQQALTRLMQGRTTLVIAHRLSTIRAADRIAVMEGGRVVETGAHDSLIAANGIYARLHRLQFEGADIVAD